MKRYRDILSGYFEIGDPFKNPTKENKRLRQFESNKEFLTEGDPIVVERSINVSFIAFLL